MRPSHLRVAYLYLTGARVPADLGRIDRAKSRSQELWDKDVKDLKTHLERAETAFKALAKSRPMGAYVREVKERVPPAKRERLFMTLLRTDDKTQQFAERFVGLSREGKVRGLLRDFKYKRVDLDKLVGSIRSWAKLHFKATRLTKGQEPLRRVLPEELLRFFPPNIHVEVDKTGSITRMTDHFEAKRESLETKIATQKALVKRYNQIVKLVKADLRSRDEMVHLPALITSILMETGIRPGAEGNAAPMKGPNGEVLRDEEGNKIYADTFGAVTLGPEHIRFVRTGFAELVFPGKKSTVNIASLSDAAVLSALDRYVAAALAGGSSFIFVNRAGELFTDEMLRSYLRKRVGKWLRPTDFRKLKSTEQELASLIGKQQDLYTEIRGFVKAQVDDLEQRVVQAVETTLEAAITEAQIALSHEDFATTIRSYLNPEVILRFLATGGDIEATLADAIVKNKPALVFDAETFIAQATKAAAGGLTLLDVMERLEGDLEESGVSAPPA
jgi:hypothetical protein